MPLLPAPSEKEDDDPDITLVDGFFVPPGSMQRGGLTLRESLFDEANVRVHNHLGGTFLRVVPCTQPLDSLVTEDEDECFAGLYFYDTGSAAVFMMAFRGDAAWTLFRCVGEERKSIRTGTSRDRLRRIFVGPGMPIFLYGRDERFLPLAERLLGQPVPTTAQYLKLHVKLCRHLEAGGAAAAPATAAAMETAQGRGASCVCTKGRRSTSPSATACCTAWSGRTRATTRAAVKVQARTPSALQPSTTAVTVHRRG